MRNYNDIDREQEYLENIAAEGEALNEIEIEKEKEKVFCEICNELIPKENAIGLPEDNPKNWLCKNCLK